MFFCVGGLGPCQCILTCMTMMITYLPNYKGGSPSNHSTPGLPPGTAVRHDPISALIHLSGCFLATGTYIERHLNCFLSFGISFSSNFPHLLAAEPPRELELLASAAEAQSITRLNRNKCNVAIVSISCALQ